MDESQTATESSAAVPPIGEDTAVQPSVPAAVPEAGQRTTLVIGLITVGVVGAAGFLLGRLTAPPAKTAEVKLVKPLPVPTVPAFPTAGAPDAAGSRPYQDPDGYITFAVPAGWAESQGSSPEYKEWTVGSPNGGMAVRYYRDPGLMMAECVVAGAPAPRYTAGVSATVTTHLPSTGGALCEGSANPPGEVWLQSTDAGVPFGFTVIFSPREQLGAAQAAIETLAASAKPTGRRQAVTPTPAPFVPPVTWKSFTPTGYGMKFRYPEDWTATPQPVAANGELLVNLTKTDVPVGAVSLTVKPSWENTGNAQTLPRNFRVGTGIPAARFDPPKADVQKLERYQTNVYWQYANRVYVFTCVHNWNREMLETCDRILSTVAP